jgi:hypothetical protein
MESHEIKQVLIEHFAAPCLAILVLGGFGALCVGLIHKLSFGLLIFVPLTLGAILILVFITCVKIVLFWRKNSRQS